MNYKFVCPCLFGLEGLVADELRAMNALNVTPETGRVFFEGGVDMLARANINSRYSERVLIHMGTFKALTFEQLFEGVRALNWKEWIGKQDAFPVKGRSLSSQLSSIPDCQSIIKKAVVENLKPVYNVPWFEETGDVFQIQFLIIKDTVTVMIDTTGDGLHKRGYRANSTEAPIKETLAAAMCRLAKIQPNRVLIDPFCGSGTILIEGVMMALNIAPGLKRRFAAEKWEKISQDVWMSERKRANEAINQDAEFTALGFDNDAAAVSLTAENAKKAGVAHKITVEKRDFADWSYDGEKATIVCNPPYGERLMDRQQAAELYKLMGKKFMHNHWYSYFIISPDDDFENLFSRPADKRRKLYNGMIKCQLYMYFK